MIQIDVIKINTEQTHVQCNMYTEDNCVKIYMSITDYESLLADKFFVRDGKTVDSANVLNTSEVYYTKKK